MKQTKRSTMIIVGLAMSVIGIAALVWGGFSLSSYLNKKKTYVETTGIVVAYKTKYGRVDDYDDYYDDETYAPIVEYVVDGKVYETIHDVYSNPPQYSIGQKVALKYNPRNPEDVIFKFDSSFGIIFLIGTIFAGCGLPMTFVGIFKKKDKNI